MGYAYVVGTVDTKGRELTYVADLVRAAGVEVRTVDLTTVEGWDSPADVTPADVAGTAEVFTGERGSAVAAMAEAFTRHVLALPAGELVGILGAGGSGATALVTPAMQALPVGLPKLMVSTMASGDVAAYVGASDIAMLHSVTDVGGLNRISRVVLGNAAHALAGMVASPVPEAEHRPAVALSMFGVTTPCVTALVDRLEADHDCLVFHATGAGGRAMEKLVDDRLVAAVLDVTTTEIADEEVGGILTAGPDRIGSVARTETPYVGSCGALDMVNFGARESVPERFENRLLHVHNAQVTLMRTTAEECAHLGAVIAEKLNACDGPVRFLLPTGGLSLIDVPGQPFHDPEADEALFAAIEAGVRQTADRVVRRVPAAVNDDEFVEAVLAALAEVAPTLQEDPQ
ncbi:Tm-1-like ATP-binding domain-containing protein [Marmoricola endophyticus]|uniref:Tm-1-like ATP-binding domain-containing protein n=1 Tax=Marmoricola endophyticus TaxID=2040280 RepID=UPI001669AF54|nr:Tm-1-like ATP-binding domain-containing protein [Marmoricola endophyticus]